MAEDASRFGYERVIAGILRTIREQNLDAGAKLPTLPEIQDQYDVSSTTARRAVDDLKRQGVVISRQGSGLFVQDPAQAAKMAADKDDEFRRAVNALREELGTLGQRMSRIEDRLEQLLHGSSADEDRTPERPSRRPGR